MNIKKVFVPLALLPCLFLAGSVKKIPKQPPVINKNLPTLQLKPQALVDTVKFHTIEYMDDAPVLPRFRGK